MIIELDILKAMSAKKEYFIKYASYLNIQFVKSNYPVVNNLFTVLRTFYERFTDKVSITPEELEGYYIVSYPVLKDSARSELHDIILKMKASTASEDVILELLEQHRVRSIANDVALIAVDVAEGRRTAQELLQSVQRIGEASTLTGEVEFVTDDLETIYERNMGTKGLRWRLPWLNLALGSLRKGDFGFLFARPETGKTTFLASEVTFMATQTNTPILWFNNEEQGEKVKLRCYNAALGLTSREIFTNRREAMELYMARTKGNIKIIDQAQIHKGFVEQVCEKYKPALVIFDQIDKLTGFDEDRTDLILGKVYQWARELAKEYSPVIGVCQAGDAADGVRWLNMNHASNARTSKQAEADWILGIGKVYEEGLGNARFFNISKNKLLGDEDTVEELRHGKHETILEAPIARYRSA